MSCDANPKDFDISIHNRRILYILDRTISRVRHASIVCNILVNPCYSFAFDLISEDVKDNLSAIKARYLQRNNENCDPWKPCEQLQQKDDSTLLAGLLEYVGQNQKLQYYADNKCLPIPSQYKLFTKCLSELRNSVATHLEENISQERAREERLRICRLKNDEASKEIAILEKELADKKSDFNASIIGKNLLVNRQQNKIEKIRKVTQEAIDRRASECEAAIAADKSASDNNLQTLTAELQQLTRKHEDALKENLEAERLLRIKRTKVENQLALWMQNFDQEMSDMQSEEERLQSDFDREKKKYEEIQRQLDEQEEEYDELMQEKAAYEQQLVEQKLFLFILNRSARRIQRAFRAYKLRKLAKKAKKGKKGKNKKK